MSDYADAWFRTAFEDAAIGMAIMSLEGEYLRVNRALCAILGRDADTLLGSSILDTTHPDDHALVLERLPRLAAGEASIFEERHMHPDGHDIWVMTHVSPVPDRSGRPGFLVSQVQDMSARRHMEEALRQVQKMDAVGRLAGGIAHDFNNLLTAARLNVELLRAGLPAGDAGTGAPSPEDSPAELLDEVRHALDRATALTAQLLTISRRSFARPSPLDLAAAVRRLEPILRRLAGPRVTLTVSLAPDIAWISADQGQIDEVLLTLVARARDAIEGTGSGGAIDVAAREVELARPRMDAFGELPAGRYATISVQDDAPALPARELERVFEPFYFSREGADRGRVGLGLAAVYGIARQSGGHAVAEVAPGGGTRFTLYFPAP